MANEFAEQIRKRLAEISDEEFIRIMEQSGFEVSPGNGEIEFGNAAASRFSYRFEASTVDKWKHCPSCGEELIEIYSGDYHGHLSCVVCESDNDFTVTVEEAD